MWLYYWETYGVNKALSLFLQSYIKDKSHVKNAIPTPEFMEAVIRGKLNYLSMVKGRENNTYLKLKERLEMLSSQSVDIENILNVWEKEGIENAINIYEKIEKMAKDKYDFIQELLENKNYNLLNESGF